jgi:hypothetical protein
MPISTLTSTSYNVDPRPTPAAPTVASFAAGLTADEVVLTVNIPTVDTNADPLAGDDKVSRISLYWSTEPLPTSVDSLTSGSQPTIKSTYNSVDADVLATTEFTFGPVKPGYPVYTAVFASND